MAAISSASGSRAMRMLAILTPPTSAWLGPGSGAARLEPLAGRPRGDSKLLQSGEDDSLERADEDRSLERVWKHAVAEELAAFQIRVRGGEESLAGGAREHRRDPGGQKGHVGDRCFPRQVRPADASVLDLVLGDLPKDPLEPVLHLLREQR